MKRTLAIALCLLTSLVGFAQVGSPVIDSLQDVLKGQEVRDKVLTMIELEWEFYDISFDDCIDWGEKAIDEAHKSGLADLEAKANYVLGIQYAHHADLDLAKVYLNRSYAQNIALADSANAFEALWSIATYELSIGSVDSAQIVYDEAFSLAKSLNDSIAIASVIFNQAVIHYQKGEAAEALNCNYEVRKIFADMGLEETVLQINANIATIYLENGKPMEAKKMFIDLLPAFEANEDYYLLQSTCMNLGSVYARNLFNYDTAMYYFEKSMYYADCQVEKHFDQNRMRVLKADALSEMANVSFQRGDDKAALKGYAEALALSESENYLPGQMQAQLGLGTAYAQLGQAEKSLDCLKKFFELETKTGILKLHAATRLPLIIDYARLGWFDDLEAELRDIDDENNALLRQNTDLHDRNHELEDIVADLIARNESQSTLLDAHDTQLKHYRLSFFGLLAIVIATLSLLAAYKIVRKKRPK